MKQLFKVSYQKVFLAFVLLISLIGKFLLPKTKLTAYASYANYCTPMAKYSCQSGATGVVYENYKLVEETETLE